MSWSKSAAVSLTSTSAAKAWTFPLLLAVVVFAVVWTVTATLGLPSGPTGDPLSARLTWAVGATLFAVVFAFAVLQCHVLMFRCGQEDDAMAATVVCTVAGAAVTLYLAWDNELYLGPAVMKRLLDATAYSLGYVRLITAVFDGFACWAAFVVLATSTVILRKIPQNEEELSRHVRASRILLYVGSALLITGVSQSAALHRWPAHELDLIGNCCGDLLPNRTSAAIQAFQAHVETTANAISSAAGTACSLVLAAAYLPLSLLLRQRAYAVVTPWQRTEAWLAMHGLGLQPLQQLGRVLLMLGPLLAGGPVQLLLKLITQ